jgi:ABC-type transport system substrate-binding protein
MQQRDQSGTSFAQGGLTRREFIALAGSALVASALTGCGGLSLSSKPSQLVVSRDEEIQLVDTQTNVGLINYDLYRHIYDYLVDRDGDGKLIPALAESWEVSKDGLAWTFQLKKGVKFHNGEDFNSQSVKVMMHRLRDENLPRSSPWLGLIDVVDTPADYVAIIRTKKPMGIMLTNLAMQGCELLPPKALAEKGAKLFDNHIGTGPYKFVEWVKNERFVMERWPDSWDKRAKIDKIVHRPILEDSTRIAALRAGDIDLADTVPSDQLKVLEADGKFNFIRKNVWDVMTLGLKVSEPPFNNKFVRQAINYAVDREALVNKILGGGRATAGWIAKGLLGFHPDLKVFPYDPEKAKALLKEGGYKGDKIAFIGPNSAFTKIVEIEQAILAQFAESGLNIDFKLMDWSAFRTARAAGTYQMFITGGGMTDPSGPFNNRILTDQFNTGYKNEEMFNLIRAGASEVDQQKRTKIYQQLQEMMYEDAAPFILLYEQEQIVAAIKGLQGFTVDPVKIWNFRAAQVNRG